MPKILLILSVVFMIGSAVLGYMNKGKLTASADSQVAFEQKVNTATAEATSTKKALADAKAKLSAETAKQSEMEQQIAAKEAEAAKATADVTNLTAQLTDKTAALDAKTAEMEAALAAKPPEVPGTTPVADPGQQVTELNAQIEALKGEKQIIGDKLIAAESKTKEMAGVLAKQKNAMVAKGLEGQIIAVNQAWGFVVLNLGDRSGVVNNAEMVVMRDGDRIGRVKITSVEPSNSIADILTSSVADGQRVMPGDRVIYTGN